MIFTIGHSTRTNQEVEEMLLQYGVTLLVDVRSYPGSRFVPQWNQENIKFKEVGYKYINKLGGRRRALPLDESLNKGWRNKSFRGYADYMQTEDFKQGLAELEDLAQRECVAFMCSEAVWWRCHRSMIADALVAKGWRVFHIMDTPQEHKLRDFAVVGKTITYP